MPPRLSHKYFATPSMNLFSVSGVVPSGTSNEKITRTISSFTRAPSVVVNANAFHDLFVLFGFAHAAHSALAPTAAHVVVEL